MNSAAETKGVLKTLMAWDLFSLALPAHPSSFLRMAAPPCAVAKAPLCHLLAAGQLELGQA